MSSTALFGAEQITAIAEEVFAAMVDGETGALNPWLDGPVTLTNPLHAWVELQVELPSRVLLTTERETADDLARALLAMEPDEPVSEDDLVDAFGEVANVVGGNLKALLPVHGKLALPQVSADAPSAEGATPIDDVALSWRGRLLTVSVWTL
ncbi:chemotaxis protein CheX [Cellulomonas fimi]|uniref:Chemotaxis protein CheX n=1 Tax=Cellulomonas fimi TaxID=1708 RepID=A0A7Y0LYJ2_CELFI|nr:chemotaxis protein CheX [Cellulomonas fimi]NMR20543.1 chemotaxis protein CheX [Cellulomonas fimi]